MIWLPQTFQILTTWSCNIPAVASMPQSPHSPALFLGASVLCDKTITLLVPWSFLSLCQTIPLRRIGKNIGSVNPVKMNPLVKLKMWQDNTVVTSWYRYLVGQKAVVSHWRKSWNYSGLYIAQSSAQMLDHPSLMIPVWAVGTVFKTTWHCSTNKQTTCLLPILHFEGAK